MKYLEKMYAHERDKLLKFDSETHTYIVNNVYYKSVSTIIASLFDKFDADACIRNMIESKNWVNHELFGKSVEEIKEIWARRNQKAMEEGVRLHEDIENYLNKITVDNKSIEYQYFLNFIAEQKLNVYRTEWRIFHEGFRFAGTIDMCSKNQDGTLSIYDWKRSKSIKRFNSFKYAKVKGLHHIMDTNFYHYVLQLNLYKFILEEKYDFKVTKMYLVCLHPENKNNDYLVYTVPFMSKEILLIMKRLE